MAFNPYPSLVKRFNKNEYTKPHVDSPEEGAHLAHRTASGRAMANQVRHDQQLETLHESIRELGRLALPHVGTDKDITGAVEIIRPLSQDRLFSEKLRRLNVGQGFTRSEYLAGLHTPGAEKRRFHVMQEPGFDDVRGIVLPYTMAGMPSLTKRPRVRLNYRPEDLAIALDDSGRSWSGVFVPHGTPKGLKSEELPRFGVLEDSKSTTPTLDDALARNKPIRPTHEPAIVDRTRWLAKIEDRVIGLQQQVTPNTHPSHDHTPRP
jgi:hypothetical protein